MLGVDEEGLQHSPENCQLFLTAIRTVMRSGEIEDLQWNGIDWNGRFITVRRNIVRGQVHRTKTEKTRRVDMSDALFDELSKLKKQRREEWLSRGKNEIPEWVFCNREGNHVDMHDVKNRNVYRCLKEGGPTTHPLS